MKTAFFILLLSISSISFARIVENRMLATQSFVVDALENVNVNPNTNRCGVPTAVSCTDRFVGDLSQPQSICSEWNRGTMPYLETLTDGSVVVNPLAIDQALDNENTPSPLFAMFDNVNTSPVLAQKRLEGLDLLKRVLREQITQGQPTESLNESQRFLLFKLDTLRVSYENADGCQDYPYNASYSGVLNTLNICPLLTHVPVESYLSLLAHELGHMSDPCFSFMDLYPFSPAIAALRNNRPAQIQRLRTEITSCLTDVPAQARNQFITWATGNSRLANQGFSVYAREDDVNRNFILRLRECGVATAPPALAPRTYAGHPYLPVISCVATRHQTTPRTINETTRIVEGTQGQSCDRSSVMTETVADYVGSSVIARMLTLYPNAIPRERSALIPMFYSGVRCSGGGDPTYLKPADRMRLYLQPSAIQQSLGCDGSDLPEMCPLPTSLTGVP